MSPEVIIGVLALGLLVGVMSAMFGVGGGVIMVPFIVLVFDETQQVAEGTSLLVVVPTAIVGVIAHARRGYVDFRRAALVAASGVAGAYLGARLALEMDADILQTFFGVFVTLVGVRFMWDGLRAKRSRQPG